MNPILKYPGAKWRLAPWIVSHIEPHESYVEPFFGSGGVFFNKPPARIETLNDINGEVVNFFRICRERPDDLADALRLTPWARAERDNAYNPAGDELEQARRFAVKCWQTFGAFPRKSNGWRHTTAKTLGGGPDNPKLWARLPQSIHEASERLLTAQFDNRPALEVIKRFNGPEVLIYADPPYVKQTRTASGDAYNHEMSDADHEELLRTLMAHTGMVLLSGYDSELYNDMLRGWTKETENTRAERGAQRTECLWLNPAAARADHASQMQLFTNSTNNNEKNEKNISNSSLRSELDTRAERFTPPTLEEVSEYCRERGNRVDPQGFIDFYASKGWMVGKSPMKDWKAALRNAEKWERWDRPSGKAQPPQEKNYEEF